MPSSNSPSFYHLHLHHQLLWNSLSRYLPCLLSSFFASYFQDIHELGRSLWLIGDPLFLFFNIILGSVGGQHLLHHLLLRHLDKSWLEQQPGLPGKGLHFKRLLNLKVVELWQLSFGEQQLKLGEKARSGHGKPAKLFLPHEQEGWVSIQSVLNITICIRVFFLGGGPGVIP